MINKLFSFVKKNIFKYIIYYELLRSSLRKKILVEKGFYIGKNTYIGHRSKIYGNKILIGDNVTIVSDALFMGDITIGSNCIFAANCKILTISHDYFNGNALPYGTDYINKKVIIEDNVWVGMDVKIVPGVTIGEGAFIAMGSVVTKNIPALAVAGGNPAVVLKYRDKEKYERLKKEKRFLNNIRSHRMCNTQKYDKYIFNILKVKSSVSENDLTIVPLELRSASLYNYSIKNNKLFWLAEDGYQIT